MVQLQDTLTVENYKISDIIEMTRTGGEKVDS